MRLGKREPRLSEGRIELRRHRRENFPLYENWYADEEIWNLTSWRSTPMSPSETRRLFEDRKSSDIDSSFAIHVKGDSTPIGIIGLMNLDRENASADLTIIIGSEEDRHKGYGFEAIEAILGHAFEELGLERVGLSVFDFNETALKTYERVGFKETSRMRRAINRSGEPHDAILMSVTKAGWESRNPEDPAG